jgi:hypothetical protein
VIQRSILECLLTGISSNGAFAAEVLLNMLVRSLCSIGVVMLLLCVAYQPLAAHALHKYGLQGSLREA